MIKLATFIALLFSITLQSQSIVGQWETYDDTTNEKKAIIEIYKQDDSYFAKIVKNFVREETAVCSKCKGDKKDKSILGLVIIEDLKEKDDSFEDGTILDPESGDVYKCYLKLEDENKLKVRGFIGFSIIGRTQYWLRKE